MKPFAIVLLTSTMLVAADSARAQTGRANETQAPVEIAPYVFVGSNGSTGAGAAVRWPVASKLGVEVETALRDGEVTGFATSLNVVYDLPSIGRVTPYVTGGVGLEQYGTVMESPLQGLVTVKQTAFTVNAGGGIRVPIDDNWGMRSDARWSNGIGRMAPERWRVYNGVTFGTGR